MTLFLAGYIEGNGMQSYHCHTIFKLVVLYSSPHLPILYQLCNHVYHLVWEYVHCDYTCHRVCQAKQKLAKAFSIMCPKQAACWGKHSVLMLFRRSFCLQISSGGLSLWS